MCATDRRQTKASLNAPAYYGRGIIMVIRSIRFLIASHFVVLLGLYSGQNGCEVTRRRQELAEPLATDRT